MKTSKSILFTRFLSLASAMLLVVVATLGLTACLTTKQDRFVRESEQERMLDKNPELKRRVGVRLQLASGYYQDGNYKQSLEEIKQVLLLAPDYAEAFGLRALVQMELKDTELAEQNFLQALKLDPHNSGIANNYAWFLCQNNRVKESWVYYDRVLTDRFHPNLEKSALSAGVCALKIKDLGMAEHYFNVGYQFQPEDPSVNANLAHVYYEKALYAKARTYIQRVLKKEIYAADVLWLAIKIDHKLAYKDSVTELGLQLRKLHPESREFGLLQRGAFNE